MPNYSFKNNDTGEEYVLFLSISGREEYLAANPHVEQIITHAPALHSGRGLGVRKLDDGFKDLIDNMKKNIPGNTIKT